MSAVTREVVTLQIGHYSNFVGTHWWNLQNATFVYHPSQLSGPKEINSDVLFREGVNLMNEVTYTPRLIAFDLKGSLNSLKQSGTLYDVQEHDEDLPWPNDITMHKLEVAPKNEFLRDLEKSELVRQGQQPVSDQDVVEMTDERDADASNGQLSNSLTESLGVFGPNSKMYSLDDSVQVWSDFLRPHIHPRSLHIINNYQHESEVQAFDIYGLGVEAYGDERNKSAIDDKLHFFTEECDNLQGFNMLVDAFNGFGGLSTALIEEIRDEFPNKAIMLYSVSPPPQSTLHQSPMTQCQRQYQIVNTAITYQRLIEHTSVLLPLSPATSLWQNTSSPVEFPHLHYRAELAYHTSAILAAAIESLSMPYRTVNNPSHMNHLTSALTPLNRKVVSVKTLLPTVLPPSVSLVDMLNGSFANLPAVCQSLTPSCTPGILPDALSTVIYGFTHLISNQQSNSVQLSASVDDLIASALHKSFGTSLNAICTMQQPCRVSAPFPHIFTPDVSTNGRLTILHRPPDKGVESVAMMTFVESSRSVEGHLEELLTQTRGLDFKRLHRLTESGVELEEVKEVVNGLEAQLDCYRTDSFDMI